MAWGSLTPSDAVGCKGIVKTALKDPHVLDRPDAGFDFPEEQVFRDKAPVAAVGAAVPVIAHDEVLARRDRLRTPVAVIAVLWRDVIVMQQPVVDVDRTRDNANDIARRRNHTLDEQLLRTARIAQHND